MPLTLDQGGDLCLLRLEGEISVGMATELKDALLREGLAGYTDTILELAAGIVACVESETVSSVLPRVQALGTAANHFVGERLRATSGILEMVTKEVDLLHRLSLITQAQTAIALETRALRVLTNIEVARLGDVGSDFHYLAEELVAFSKSVSEDTQSLDSHTAERRAAIDKTKDVLSLELPELKEKLASTEVDLGEALAEASREERRGAQSRSNRLDPEAVQRRPIGLSSPEIGEVVDTPEPRL